MYLPCQTVECIDGEVITLVGGWVDGRTGGRTDLIPRPKQTRRLRNTKNYLTRNVTR